MKESDQKIPDEKIGEWNFYPIVFMLKWVSLLNWVTH